MVQALDRQIIESLPFLADGEKQSLLGVIRSFLQLKEDGAMPLLSEEAVQYNQELDQALERVRAGEFLTQQDVEKESEHW